MAIINVSMSYIVIREILKVLNVSFVRVKLRLVMVTLSLQNVNVPPDQGKNPKVIE